MAPPFSRRTAVAAAGLAVVGLGGVAALAARSGDPSPSGAAPSSRAPSGAAPSQPGGSRPPQPIAGARALFGAAPEGARGDYPAALASADQTLGTLGVVRVYYQGAPDPWPGKAPGRNVVVSFKLPPEQVLSGALDDTMRQWFATAPRDLDVRWAYEHEPESQIRDGQFTAQQFRDAFAHLSALAKQAANPRLKATLILQSYTLKPQAARDWHEFYPGDAAVDVFAWDVYNRPKPTEPYTPPAQLLDGPRAVSESVGKAFAVAELGSIIAQGDDGTGRAAWLRDLGYYVKAHPTDFVAYFDLDFQSGPNGRDDYRLRDPASVQAWREITTG